MRCIVVDDEEMSRINLRGQCSLIPDLEVVEEFDNALDAYKFLSSSKVDLVFLDIEMPNFSGLDLVNHLQDPPNVIFTTAKENYAASAFNHIENVVDYIVKPVTFPRLFKAIERFRLNVEKEKALEEKSNDAFFIKVDKRLVRISFSELLYIETQGDYSIFKTRTEKYTAHVPLKQVESKLPQENFLRVHRSFIVNLNEILDIEENSLVIDHKVIPISRSQRPQLMKRISLL